MKAIILNHHDIFGRRYKSVIICEDNETMEEVMNRYPYSEIENYEEAKYVVDSKKFYTM